MIEHPPYDTVSRYRFRTTMTDMANAGHTIETLIVKNVEIIFIAKVNNLYRYQALCFDTEMESNAGIASNVMVQKISRVFDEVKLSTDIHGNIVSLHNLGDLQQRWITIRDGILKDGEGHVVKQYFAHVAELLVDENKVVGFLKNHKMLGMYFNGYLGGYEKNTPRKKQVAKVDFLSGETVEETITEQVLGETTELSVKGNFLNTETGQTKNKLGYNGTAIYEKHKLVESFIETQHNFITVKYAALWVG